MQSLIQMDQELNPVTPATAELPPHSETDADRTAQIEPGPRQHCTSAGSGEDAIAAAQPDDEDKTDTEQTPAHSAVTPAVGEKEDAAQSRVDPSTNAREMAVNTCSEKNPPAQPTRVTNTSPGRQEEKAKKEEKVLVGRKYVPSKKAMMDPLKMDMSKPLVIPLSSSELSLQCMECHIIFSDHKSKERHLKLSHPAEYEQRILRNALFVCYVCDSYFTNSAELMAHQKTHVERKPFRCPICSQAFKKSSELTLHKKIHLCQGGYACTDCGKPCKTLTLLKYHRRTHTGERPYVCKECGKRFSMSKALQKHMLSHLPEGAEEDTEDATDKAQQKKNDVKYPCSVCNATFKTTKTRRRHMISKHNMSATSSNTPQGKHSNPVITPISFFQPSLLQVEPNGPLQKVDANIDTEPIRRLIETLGNVQKVNQVVILGQVPLNAPPLEVQQIPELSQTMSLNLDPSQIDIMGLKQAESKTIELDFSNNSCDPMQQTIILEPITPDGQLENPSFSALGHTVAGEQIELSVVESEQTVGPDVEVMHQILHQAQINTMQSEPMDQIACHNEGQEETVILELTPALIPTDQLEQPHDVPQHEIPSTSLVPTTELENPLDQAVIEEHQTSLSDPPLMPVELDLTPVESIQQDLPTCPFVPPETITTESDAVPPESCAAPTKSESHFKVDADIQMQTASLDQVHTDTDCGMPQETQEKTEQEDGSPVEEMEDSSAKEKAPSPLKTKQMPQISELPVNVMSAQELVKVRKRKSARAFIFQHMHELQLVGHNDDLQIKAKPAKRQKNKKSHLVVKFGPQNKERKNKKKKKQSQKRQGEVMRGKATNLSEKKTASPKKGKKDNKGKKAVHSVHSTPDATPTEITQDPPVPQTKEEARKNKTKKQEDVAREVSQHMSKRKAVFKKKMQGKIIQKGSSQNAKNRKMTNKEQKNKEEKASTDSANIPGPHVPQDCLLLLKGHKQPQLKVYKLDPTKAPGKTTQEASPESQPKPQQIKNGKRKAESTNNLMTEEKKKGGRPKKTQKVLSMLSPLQVSNQKPETLPVKPKTTRKRKANVETEGVITSSHSKRALECKDCGERFGEVSSLQKHKATVHIVETPGLTYTNGNIFEGVSSLELHQLPKQHERIIATDWDTEPETPLEDRQRSVSFPALIPSPPLPVPPADVQGCRYEGGDKTTADSRSPNAVGDGSADQIKTSEPSSECSSEPHITASNQRKSSDASASMVLDKQECAPESAGQATTDEDIKEDVLLEVDLVTIGEQIERDNEDSVSQNESSGTCNVGVGNTEASVPTGHVHDEKTKKGPTSQTVSCTAHQMEIKEEEEEVLVQRKKEAGKGAACNMEGGRRKGVGHLKRDLMSKRVPAEEAVSEAEKEHDDCQVVYEEHVIAPDSPTKNGYEGSAQTLLPEISAREVAVTTRAAEGITEGEEHDRGSNPSPGVIFEKVLTLADAGNNQRLGLEHIAGNQEIKVEENASEPTPVVPTCQQSASVQSQNHCDMRTVLVKEETNLVLNDTQATQGSRHIRWNVEQINTDDAGSPLMEIGDTTSSCHVTPTPTPAFNTSQCIFYPVKEEEREVLVGAACTSNGNLSAEASADAQQMQDQTASDSNLSEGSHTAQDYQNMRVTGSLPDLWTDDYADIQDEAEAEGHNQSDLRSFLLQGSDEDDAGHVELAESQIPSEAEVMAQFYKTQISSSPQSAGTSQSLPTLRNQLSRRENRTKKPIEYFSNYFHWDTWVEIAHSTNRSSRVPDLVTAREVAQFIGIHIAMGTLKFPSLRLYWEDLTRVPLIADAMSLSRFLQLTAVLKLASLAQDLGNFNHGVERNQDPFQDLQSKTHPNMQSEIPQQSYRQCQQTAELDPLLTVQPLLHRFHRGCQSLKRDGDYAVDQYPLLLTGRTQKRKLFLHCTTLIGFGGLFLHVDLKPDLLDKEDAVEKMVPKGSMVFLCKQELSTPAMLERLLAAGIHGAGRVGGARGQIGDEFVSSDGKLMLRRSHCGFILSTAGNVQRNMSSLIENFERAQVSARLNRDLYNLYPIPLTASTLGGWPQAVLWYLTDLALVNSWLVYRQDHGPGSAPLTLMAFRLEVSKALILSSGSDTQDSVPPQPPTETVQAPNETPNTTLLEESPLPDAATRYDCSGHWPEQLAEGEGGRCRFGNCQRTSRVLCLKCCVFLCISRNHNCFLNFHNQSLGKQ